MMNARTVMQEALFYSFRIDDHVPGGHLLSAIGRFVDLSGIRKHLKPFYSATGPSLDRSRFDDPDADRRLLYEHPVGTATV